MSIKTIGPLVELKGHKAPVLAVEYVKNSPLGEHILASGSGIKKVTELPKEKKKNLISVF